MNIYETSVAYMEQAVKWARTVNLEMHIER